MIGGVVTGADGKPVDGNGRSLSPSMYQPSNDVKDLMMRVQSDYLRAYNLQHRPFREFDDHSLLERAALDQATFAAYVERIEVPRNKKWRWRGRKPTARNKLIGILARLLAAMLFPMVTARNNENEDDKLSARVMGILVEDHLKKAGYETKFLFIVLSALVNPAVFVGIEYVQAMQRIKMKLADGTMKIVEAVDEILTGLHINNIPVDELLLADFYTPYLQHQPNIFRVRRIPYDVARGEFAGKHFDEKGKDLFEYVRAGMTRVVIAGQENQTLFDIEWTEGDINCVQVITEYVRGEDLEVTTVGGVFMGNQEDPYNSNPMTHRRMVAYENTWILAPIYPYAKSGFEPIDPTGRFTYYKSGAFKEYWSDLFLNEMDALMHDGTYLDVIKPAFISGVSNFNPSVMVPGAVSSMPANATVTFPSIGPNMAAIYTAIQKQKDDLSESTAAFAQEAPTPNVTAQAVAAAQASARLFIGVFSIFIAQLVKDVGELTVDCVIQNTTLGEIDATVPENLKLKYKPIIATTKDKGRDITHHIVFSGDMLGRTMSEKAINAREWQLWNKAGGYKSGQKMHAVNPYQFARTKFSLSVDATEIMDRSLGTDQVRNEKAFNILTDPRVAPYTDSEAVVNDFAIEEYGGSDPDRYKRKGDSMMPLMPGAGGTPAVPVQGNNAPVGSTPVQLPTR